MYIYIYTLLEQIELQAKLLNYFLGSNKSNINQYIDTDLYIHIYTYIYIYTFIYIHVNLNAYIEGRRDKTAKNWVKRFLNLIFFNLEYG